MNSKPRIIILYLAAIATGFITMALFDIAFADVSDNSHVIVSLSNDKQVAGGSIVVNASGLAPATFTEISVDDGVEESSFAYIKSDSMGQIYFTIYSPDKYLDKQTTIDENGNVIENINEEHVYNGPVKVIVRDDKGNVDSADLEVIRP